jgi:hypothetical protein
MTSPFISIPKDSFTILVGYDGFLTRLLADIPGKFPHGKILYIHSEAGRIYLHPSPGERGRITFIQERNIIDIMAMLQTDPARFTILAYDPEWFRQNEEYIGPFGHVCRERSHNRKAVLFISDFWDYPIYELESVADKMVCVQESLNVWNTSHVPTSSGLSSSHFKKRGQQCLVF